MTACVFMLNNFTDTTNIAIAYAERRGEFICEEENCCKVHWHLSLLARTTTEASRYFF